ncbi:ABC transporter permease [Heyndrickxia sp. NPDC080065]|uniref:ABC transporter permease n=1 Tax=Heyndrickxia sp. NPDC080065 TaxID=3390568 RepID=UPI003CFE0171
MKQLIFHSLKRKKTTSLLFVIAFLIILVIMPLSSTSLQDAHTQVKTDITYYSRGSYDLLIRPLGSEREIEKELGIVPENYLGFGNGGITLKQWKAIKNRKDIEIAAPVISLGYYTGVNTNMGLVQPEHSTRYLIQHLTTDGVNRYPASKKYACILLESPKTIDGIEKFDSIYNDKKLMNNCTEVAMVPLPTTYNLLVGIDPEQEEALTGISFDNIDEEYPYEGLRAAWKYSTKSKGKVIPVIQLEEGKSAIETAITIDTLDINPAKTKELRVKIQLDDNYLEGKDGNGNVYRKGTVFFSEKFYTEEYRHLVQELLQYPAEKHVDFSANTGSIIQPFNPNAVEIDEAGKVNELQDGKLLQNITMNDVTQYFTSGPLKYEKEGNKLIVKKVGEHDGVPIYRDIQKHGTTLTEALDKDGDVPFIIDPVGDFKIGKRKEKLASSPLGIYQMAPVYYIGNGKDKKVQMQATITPGSFVTSSARGVTNIKSAAAMKGDKPIDAIRVKVAGIKGYTKEAAKKIENIAHDIEKMGLKVTMVAGASPQKMKVDVEGVGLVEESWTTLGAAGSIVGQWNMTNMILAFLFSLVTIIYIMNRMTFWQVNKQQEMLLLYQLGWNKKHILRFSRREISILMFVAWVFSLGVLSGIQQWLHLSNKIYLWQLAITVISIFFLYFTISRKTKKTFNVKMKKKLVHVREKTSNQPHRKSLVPINLQYFYRFIRPPFIQLLLVSTLSSFVYLSLTETVQQTNVTILGEYINLKVNNWHILLIVSSYLLGLFTLVESLASILMTREQEIGIFRSIGWKINHIFKLYMKEIALWTGSSILIGNSISLIIYLSFYPLQSTVWLTIIGSFFGFYLCILLVSAIVINRYLKKELGDTLSLRRKTK